MDVICLKDEAFYALIGKVTAQTRETQAPQTKWISGEAVMKILNITSKTTLQKFRDEGKIRFSQPEK